VGVFTAEQGSQFIFAAALLEESVVDIDMPAAAGEGVWLFAVYNVKVDILLNIQAREPSPVDLMRPCWSSSLAADRMRPLICSK